MYYTEKPTPDLLDLLVTEEDRVTLELIQELAGRADAIEPLSAWLRDETRWREARDGEWWSFYHAFTILCLTRRPEALDAMLQGYSWACVEDFDWLTEISPAAFAHFGEAAVEPLINFLLVTRALDPELIYPPGLRSQLVTALTRIALEQPAVQPRVAEFVISRYVDPVEHDPAFLGFIAGDALLLDREAALEPLRAAFARDAVDETVSGGYEETLAWFVPEEQRGDWEYHQDLLRFYEPAEIERRQQRWRHERDAEEIRAQNQRAKENAHRLGWDVPDEPAVPTGYLPTHAGTVVREVDKVGRNEPCPCGSGKKYKKCCGK
jgi:hypothetical protein